jgi:hypothetical protein
MSERVWLLYRASIVETWPASAARDAVLTGISSRIAALPPVDFPRILASPSY